MLVVLIIPPGLKGVSGCSMASERFLVPMSISTNFRMLLSILELLQFSRLGLPSSMVWEYWVTTAVSAWALREWVTKVPAKTKRAMIKALVVIESLGKMWVFW